MPRLLQSVKRPASPVRSYDVELILGLLQTEDYARAAIRTAEPDASDEQVARWVELRITRQRILDSEDPVIIHAILNETVLLRQVGGREVMRAQLQHLVECAQRPNIELRVLPLSAGSPSGTTGTFQIVTLGPPFSDDVAYQETVCGSLYAFVAGVKDGEFDFTTK